MTLDIRKAGDYSQPLPVAVRVSWDKKIFLHLGKSYTMEEMVGSFAIMRKAVGKSN